MSELIVYVDRSKIREGKREELERAVKELAAFVEASEPQIIAYDVYFDEQRTHVSVLHVHSSLASLELHTNVAGPRFARFTELVEMETIDVYGTPEGWESTEVAEKLRAKARLLGKGIVRVHALRAGFARLA